MRITKSEANSISQTIATKKYGQKIKDLKAQLKEKATAEFRKTVPANVLDIFDNHPESAKYIKRNNSVKFFGNGFNHEYMEVDSTPSSGSDRYGNPETIEPRKTTAPAIKKLYDKLKKLEKDRKDLANQLEQAFISLNTYKKIKDQFPELSEYFPENQNMAVIQKFDDLHEKLNAAV